MQRFETLDSGTARKFVKHLIFANGALGETGLSPVVRELVKIRASQVNGCGACLDMHVKEEAMLAGETPLRLSLVATWRETSVFTDGERAALELTEQGTRLADSSGVSDDAWANAARHFDASQLTALVGQIAIINAFNRMNVMFQVPGGSYEAGRMHGHQA